MARRWLVVGVVVVVLVVAGGAGAAGWRFVAHIRDNRAAPLPERADAVLVFAGEDSRFVLGRQLVDEGRAPVLVLSAQLLPDVAADWCGDPPAEVEVICVTPQESSTAGEAVTFARLARERGWDHLIGVTGDYHAQRAGMLLSRCYDGEVSWGLVDWPTPSLRVTIDEVRKHVGNWLVDRSC